MLRTVRATTGLALLMVGLVGVAIPAQALDAPCCSSGDHGGHFVVAPTTSVADLGKVSPSAQNYSQLPDYQVFVFARDGLRYVEVADASGAPKAAFTAVSGTLLALPVGTDPVQQVAAPPALSAVVYEDDQVRVGVSTGPDGAVVWQVFVK